MPSYDKYFSRGSCFSKDSIITVKKNNEILKKPISEIKIGDDILTLANGNEKFIKVKFLRRYDGEYKFYEFKCESNGKIKKLTVTHNHIMIVYDKEMKELKYKLAENVIPGEDYFNTVDGLFNVTEINVFNLKSKYSIRADEGSLIANDILVSCFGIDDVYKGLSLIEIIKKYQINISS